MTGHSDADRHAAFLRLYVASEEHIFVFLRSLLPSREDAREVMQEVAVVLWARFDDLDHPANFRRWAFGVARLKAMSWMRDRRRDRLVFDDELVLLLAEEAEEDADSLAEERALLERCISRLGAAQRALLDAAYAPGARIDGLANAAGRSAMSLYKSLHRIRMTLLACVEKSRAEDGHS